MSGDHLLLSGLGVLGIHLCGGIGGVGLSEALSRRPVSREDRLILFLLWAPLWSAVAALALAHAGLLREGVLGGLSGLWMVGGIGALACRRRRSGGESPSGPEKATRHSLAFWIGWGMILLAAVPMAAKGNRYLGGWDTGVYAAAACEMGRGGSLDVTDPLLKRLSEEERRAFMHDPNPPRQAWHAGFLIQDAAEGRLRPEFYHLYPAWLSLWTWGSGTEGVWFGHAVMAIAALGMAMVAAATLLGARAALLGGVALLGCAAQLFAMRSTTAEMMTQFFLMGGCWAMARAHEQPRGRLGLLTSGAAAWATAILTHGTAYLPLGLALLVLGIRAIVSKEPRRAWPVGLVMAASAGAFLWNVIRAGTMTHVLLRLAIQHPGWWMSGVLLAGLTGLLVLAFWRRWEGGTLLLAGRPWASLLMAIGLAGLWGVGWARPLWDSGPEAWNTRIFTALTGGIGIPAALVFLAASPPRTWSAGRFLFLCSGLGTTAVLLVNKMAKPFYLWGARRWVEWPLPVVLFLAAAGGVWAYDSAPRFPQARRLIRGILLLLGGLWMALLWAGARPVLATREYEGTERRLRLAAERMRDGDAILCDHWDPAVVWRYVHGLPAWGLTRLSGHEGVGDATHAVRLMRQWLEENKKVYWAGPWFADPVLCLEPAGCFEEEDRVLEQRPDRLPQRVLSERRRTMLYRVVPYGGAVSDEITFGHSAMGLVEGFSGLRLDWDEQGKRIPHRRILGGRGVFYAPRAGGRWALEMAHQHPRQETLTVELWEEGERLAVWDVGRTWNLYSFVMPAGCGAVRLELRSPTFKAGSTRVGVAVARLVRVGKAGE